MGKSWQRGKYIVSDFLTASVAWGLFNIFRYKVLAVSHGYHSLGSFLHSSVVWEGQVAVPFIWLVIYFFSGYYNKPYGKSRLGEFFSTLLSVSVGTLLLFFCLVLNDLPDSYRTYYDLFSFLWCMQFALTYFCRLAITLDCLRKTKSGQYALHLLIIGSGEKAWQTSEKLVKLGYTVTGFIAADEEERSVVPASLLLGRWSDLSDCFRRYKVDELVVATDDTDSRTLIDKLYSLYHYALPIKVLLDKSHPLARVKLNTIYGLPLVDVTENNFSEAGRNIKWFADKVVAAFALCFLSPLFLYIAWRVKRDSEGPVFFRQERIGYRGMPFQIYKFRTMYTDAEASGPLLAKEGDKRITPFGHTMRKYRLDELPQFWNVLKGEMSLVGPRPERRYFIDQIVKRAPYYYLLHNVRPGITSLGMVKYGYAGNVDEMVERLRYDILYYENMSLALDITILVYTVKTVLTGKGV